MTYSVKKIPALTVTAIFLGMVYLWQINTLSTLGYSVTELESQKSALQQQQQRLNIAVAEAQSSETVLKKLESLDLIQSGNVSYLDLRSNVALK